MTTHYFYYGEEATEFFKTIKDLLNSEAFAFASEDCYVYEGELDEENYDDDADDYREVNALSYLIEDYYKIKEENKKLKEENEELIEDNESLQNANDDLIEGKDDGVNWGLDQEDVENWIKDSGKVLVDKDEFKELKEENEKLKNGINKCLEVMKMSEEEMKLNKLSE